MRIATPQSAKQLTSTFTAYLYGTYLEAEGMASDEELRYDRYLQIRLGSIGVRGFYAFCGLPLSIPDEVFEDPLFVELQYCGSELMLIDNVRILFVVSLLSVFLPCFCLIPGHHILQQRTRHIHRQIQRHHGYHGPTQHYLRRRCGVAHGP